MKPLLAASKLMLPEQVNLPCYVSTKLDGIRCCMVDGVAMSRNEKPIPNEYVQQTLYGLHGLDGELVLLDNNSDFNDCQSAFMSRTGTPAFAYKIFDYWDCDRSFEYRLDLVYRATRDHSVLEMIEQHRVTTLKELVVLYNEAIANHEEGLICRDPQGRYKHGRSTPKEQLSVKLKPVKSAEAIVVGLDELISKDGWPKDTLGALQVEMDGVEFSIGTGEGLTAKRRREIWDNPERYMGAIVTFQYQELSRQGVPRFPSWRGFRYEG